MDSIRWKRAWGWQISLFPSKIQPPSASDRTSGQLCCWALPAFAHRLWFRCSDITNLRFFGSCKPALLFVPELIVMRYFIWFSSLASVLKTKQNDLSLGQRCPGQNSAGGFRRGRIHGSVEGDPDRSVGWHVFQRGNFNHSWYNRQLEGKSAVFPQEEKFCSHVFSWKVDNLFLGKVFGNHKLNCIFV